MNFKKLNKDENLENNLDSNQTNSTLNLKENEKRTPEFITSKKLDKEEISLNDNNKDIKQKEQEVTSPKLITSTIPLQKPNIVKLESEVFKKLSTFLPQIKLANQELEAKLKNDNSEQITIDDGFHIEKIEDEFEIQLPNKNNYEEKEEKELIDHNEDMIDPYIQMDLNLGVFETNEDCINQLNNIPIIDIKDTNKDENKENQSQINLIEEI